MFIRIKSLTTDARYKAASISSFSVDGQSASKLVPGIQIMPDSLLIVRSGMGYWNKIIKDFPDVFKKVAQIERDVGATCLKDKDGRVFLDELPTWRGAQVEEIIPDCSLICQIEFQDIIDKQVELVLKRKISINDIV